MARQPRENQSDGGLSEDDVKKARDDLMATVEFRDAVATHLKRNVDFREEVKVQLRKELEAEVRQELESKFADQKTGEFQKRAASNALALAEKKLIINLSNLSRYMPKLTEVGRTSLSVAPVTEAQEHIDDLILNKNGHISVMSLLTSIGMWVFGKKLRGKFDPNTDLLVGFHLVAPDVVKKEYKGDPAVAAEYSFLNPPPKA